MATAGCYYFKHGEDFVNAAFNTIRKDVNYKSNYYVCSTYNELILNQKQVGVHMIDKKSYVSFATPQLYENYLSHKKIKTMINIVIPMAGAGSRFAKAGYKKPKPFIDVLGKPMIAMCWIIWLCLTPSLFACTQGAL